MVVIIGPTTPCICCQSTLLNTSARTQAISGDLQGIVATYLKCDGDVINQIKKSLLLSLSLKKKLKSGNIWQISSKKVDCLVHFLRLLAA